jgi:hypothetical protein
MAQDDSELEIALSELEEIITRCVLQKSKVGTLFRKQGHVAS